MSARDVIEFVSGLVVGFFFAVLVTAYGRAKRLWEAREREVLRQRVEKLAKEQARGED